MSLTNRQRVPGSSTRSMTRAACPPLSGIEANSTKLTLITPSVAAIGVGNGSLVVCANGDEASNSAPTTTRVMNLAIGLGPRFYLQLIFAACQRRPRIETEEWRAAWITRLLESPA